MIKIENTASSESNISFEDTSSMKPTLHSVISSTQPTLTEVDLEHSVEALRSVYTSPWPTNDDGTQNDSKRRKVEEKENSSLSVELNQHEEALHNCRSNPVIDPHRASQYMIRNTLGSYAEMRERACNEWKQKFSRKSEDYDVLKSVK